MTTSQTADSGEVLVIRPATRWSGVPLREIWAFRELLLLFTWREIKIRYRQTALGALWALLQPLAMMLTFTIFFGRMAGLAHAVGNVAYPIYVYAGLLPWTFFANAVLNSGTSVQSSASLITKVYFPRLVIPLSAVGAALVDFAVALTVLAALMVWYHTALTWQILLVPALILVTVVAATAVGTIASALIVAYRDFRYVIPFAIQLWMFLTPVIYPLSLAPPRFRWILKLNPMAGLIDGFRAAFLGVPPDWVGMGISTVFAFLLLWAGAAYFRRLERRFADII